MLAQNPQRMDSILDLLHRGHVKDNQIPLTQELVNQPSIENPFYFLSGDGFWEIAKPGHGPLYQPGNASSHPSMGMLRSAAGHFDPQLWDLMQNSASRNQLREERQKIQSLLTAPEPPRGFQLNEEFEQARSGGRGPFQRLVHAAANPARNFMSTVS